MALIEPEKKARLVAGLINKTVQGRIRWREGYNEGEFIADFSNSSVTLTREFSRDTGHEWHLLTISNNLGINVDEFTIEDVLSFIGDSSDEREFFADSALHEAGGLLRLGSYIYGLVRHHVMKVDDVYDGVLQELAS